MFSEPGEEILEDLVLLCGLVRGAAALTTHKQDTKHQWYSFIPTTDADDNKHVSLQ